MERWSRVHFELGQLRPVWPHWYLAVLGVDPRHWGQGVGSRLLVELLRLAGSAPDQEEIGASVNRAGIRSDAIYLESDREASIRFYRARGFEPRASCHLLGIRCLTLGRGFPDMGPNPCDPVRVEERQTPALSPSSALPVGGAGSRKLA